MPVAIAASAIFALILIPALFAASPAPAADAAAPGALSVETGPHRVSSGEYRFAAAVDTDVLKDQATEIWAKAYWPEGIRAGDRAPILFLLHGNHSTCGMGRSPRIDNDCSYTVTGACPVGMTVAPSHLGYEYIGAHMATHGYVAVSINANRAITCGYGASDDYGLIAARGRLILKHALLWSKWAGSGDLPPSLGVPGNTFVDAIDFSNTGLFGHSRGGEGARAAYAMAKEPSHALAAGIPGLKIKGIFEIGGTDGLSARTYDAGGVPWAQLLPICDGDVTDLSGRRPFERMAQAAGEGDLAPKALYIPWGVNHNFFNSEWQENDSPGCENHHLIFPSQAWESEKQRALGLAAVADFFRAFVGEKTEPSRARHFNPAYRIPEIVTRITNVDRDYVISPSALLTRRIDDFSMPTGRSSSGEMNAANGIGIEHQRDHRSNSPSAKVSWDRAAEKNFFQANWSAPSRAKSIEGFASLDFRVSRVRDPRRNTTLQTDFSVQLVHSDDSVSAPVRALRYGTIRGPVNAATLYQTVRIPLEAFAGARLSDIRGVKFVFDRTDRGSLLFAHVQVSSLLNLDGLADPPSQRSHPTPDPSSDPEASSAWPYARFAWPPKRAATPVRERRAFVLRARGVRHSMQLAGASAIELTLTSASRFPVTDDLPVLKIGDREFRAIRFDNGDTRRLIVSIPPAEWAGLRSGLPMQLEYGPRLLFRLGEFDRSWLKR